MNRSRRRKHVLCSRLFVFTAWSPMACLGSKCELVSLCELISNLKCENVKTNKKHKNMNGAIKLTKLTRKTSKPAACWGYIETRVLLKAHTLSSHKPLLLLGGINNAY